MGSADFNTSSMVRAALGAAAIVVGSSVPRTSSFSLSDIQSRRDWHRSCRGHARFVSAWLALCRSRVSSTSSSASGPKYQIAGTFGPGAGMRQRSESTRRV